MCSRTVMSPYFSPAPTWPLLPTAKTPRDTFYRARSPNIGGSRPPDRIRRRCVREMIRDRATGRVGDARAFAEAARLAAVRLRDVATHDDRHSPMQLVASGIRGDDSVRM